LNCPIYVKIWWGRIRSDARFVTSTSKVSKTFPTLNEQNCFVFAIKYVNYFLL
jgi:hypothetical protein